jgi:hypothetical protein
MRTQWIFLRPCGCPVGVMEGSAARVEYDAWREFYDTAKAIRAAQSDGIRVQSVSHDTYLKDFAPKMLTSQTCSHIEAAPHV